MKNSFDVAKIRKDFPMLRQKMHGKPLIYLDSAATTHKPQVVIDAMRNFYAEHYGTVHRAVYALASEATEEYENVRKKIQEFINAKYPEEIIFTRGTTESINLVSHSFGKAFIKAGDEIIISAMEHHSNIVPWQMLCEEARAILKVIPVSDKGEIDLKDYAKLLTHKTKLVAITHISNVLGTINPIKEMAAMAHASGAKILVDGAQSIQHSIIDVQDLDIDFFVFSGHKIYGPTGIGVVYGKKELLEVMPPYQGGGDMIDTVTFKKTTYNVLPLKFEAGTPMIAQVIGLGKAIDYLTSLGIDKVHKYEQKLLESATEQLQQIPGLRIIGTAKNKSSIVSFAVDKVHALDIGTMLDLRGIALRTGHLCAQPIVNQFHVPSLARASFVFYNTEEEIEHFTSALKDILKQLRS